MRMLRLALLFFIGVAGYAADPPANGTSAMAIMRDSLAKQHASLDAQKSSLRLQPSAPQESLNALFASIPPMCESIPVSEIEKLISSAARKHSLPPALIRAVMKQESGFKPCVISPRGALGLMQLMPATAQEFHAYDPFDPEQNVEAGAAFLRYLLNRYSGDLRLALGAYNSGPGRVDNAGNLPNVNETLNYVDNILADLAAPRSAARF